VAREEEEEGDLIVDPYLGVPLAAYRLSIGHKEANERTISPTLRVGAAASPAPGVSGSFSTTPGVRPAPDQDGGSGTITVKSPASNGGDKASKIKRGWMSFRVSSPTAKSGSTSMPRRDGAAVVPPVPAPVPTDTGPPATVPASVGLFARIAGAFRGAIAVGNNNSRVSPGGAPTDRNGAKGLDMSKR
jgi:hypothetical protein